MSHWFTLIAALASLPLWSQSLYNSPYSVYGPGLVSERSSILNQSLGGTGYGVQHDEMLNYMNPASYTSIKKNISHMFDIGMYVEQNRYNMKANGETATAGGLARINYWFRLKEWWSASVGLSPYSSVSYNIKTGLDLGTGGTSYYYDGDGTSSQLYFGNGFSLSKNLSVGFTGYYVFGTITRTESVRSQEQGIGLTLENELFTRRFNYDVGAQYKIDLKKNSLILGVIFEPGLTLSGRNKVTLLNEDQDTLTSYSSNTTTYKLPAKIGGGISYRMQNSIIAFDAKFQPWTVADYSDQEVRFQDSWRFSAGYSYEGKANPENYWDVIALRFGAYMQRYPMIIEGARLPSWGYSIGVGLPLLSGRSIAQITYSADHLGTEKAGLIKQQTQRVSLDLTFHSLWGKRYGYD
jgi:hypothetical protein